MTDDLDAAQRLALDALDEEYRRHYGAAVEVIKAEVGPGEEYANAAARAVVSPNGAWFECADLPMEFTGAAGAIVARRFVSDADACALLDHLHRLAEQAAGESSGAAARGEADRGSVSLFVLYDRAGILDERGVFVLHSSREQAHPPFGRAARKARRIGAYRPDTLPLAFRCRLELPEAQQGIAPAGQAGVGFRRGVIFCLGGIGERNLVVELPYEGEDLRDLGAGPANPVAQ